MILLHYFILNSRSIEYTTPTDDLFANRFNNRSLTFKIVAYSLFHDLHVSDWRLPNSAGAAIYGRGSYFIIQGTKFVNNSANMGGSIFFSECTAEISDNTTFISNTAETIGGSIAAFGGSIFLSQTYFLNNYAGGYHGAIYVINSFRPVEVKSCYFVGNRAKMSSGALGTVDSDLIVKSTHFKDNEAGYNNPNTIDEASDIKATAGAIWFQGSDSCSNFVNHLILDLVKFENNSCSNDKGKDAVLYGCLFTEFSERIWSSNPHAIAFLFLEMENTPEGISTQNPSDKSLFPEYNETEEIDFEDVPDEISFMPKMVLQDSTQTNFTNIESKQLDTGNNIYSFSLAGKSTTYQEAYSQVLRLRTTIDIRFTLFKNCITIGERSFDESGGAISAFFASVNLSSVDFISNKAKQGGGIYLVMCDLTMADLSKTNTFSKNEASERGAGIYLDGCTFSINSCNISNNTAGFGAVTFYDSDGNLTNSFIGYNSGGAIVALGQENIIVKKREIMVGDICFLDNYREQGGSDIFISGNVVCNNPSTTYFCTVLDEQKSYLVVSPGIFSFSTSSASFGKACSSCKISLAPDPNDNADEVNVDIEKNKLPFILIISGSILVVIAIISAIIFIIVAYRKKGEEDEYYSDEETTFTTSVVTLTTEERDNELVGKSLNNPMCSVSMAQSSDSLFDAIDDFDDFE